ncbi:MAG: YbaK/EbsC family protein [Nitriliruptorales bacterium]|nr:YbaK/EbsC family protein [Nitriliruptorales bacterium]
MTGQPAGLHRNSRRVLEAAAALGLRLEVTRFPAGTRTAQDAAAAIGCEVGAIVKSLVLVSAEGPLMALTSGRNRADYGKVAKALGVNGVTRADAGTVRAATGYPIGGTAPFGHPQPLPTLLDADLLAYEEVWAAAGTPETVFPLTPKALLEITAARIADIAER